MLAILAALAMSRVASAQLATEATKRIKLLNTSAMDNYDSLEFDEAKKELLEALKLAQTAKLKDKTLRAQTHLNLGVVYGAGFNNRIAAIKEFTAALKLNRKLTLSAARATPALEEMYKSAKDSLGPEVPEPSAFRHKVVDEATSGQSVIIRVQTRPSLGASSVTLYYRKSGTARFVVMKMTAYPGGVYRTTIPASDVAGRSIYYYIEAKDDSGGRLAGSGEAASPNIISITPAVKSPDGGGPKPPKKKPANDDETSFSFAILAGAGFGIVFGGESENSHPRANGALPVDIAPGAALSPAHVGVDLAYHFSQNWHLSALVRIQLLNAVRGNNTSEKISVLGLVRAKRFFGDGLVRFYLHFGAGGGQLRHRIPLGDYDTNNTTDNDIVDSRVAGLVAFGFGGGLHIAFHKNVGFVTEIGGLIMVPNFAAHADLNIGLAFSF
ncbi:MAG: hypothetical protein CSA65_01470 [Proteobacteria bacterium]|nr:MAG: hypothetical protein CSB49_03140 [Pseudomonadota bacterium]PIE19681.1 MAG: hypothetical protein CSA65_01470 [Pseudomonadota bacterium]